MDAYLNATIDANDAMAGPWAKHRRFFIFDLVETGLLMEDQMGNMRTAGGGWEPS